MSGRTSRHHVGTCCSAGDWPPRSKELARSHDLLQQENEKLRKQIAEQNRHIEEQEKQLADLRRQLMAFQKNSSNSSKPPSSDRPFKPTQARRSRPESKRKPGGQLGHPGHWRSPVPPEQVQQVVPVLPLCCKHCGQGLPQRLEEIQAAGQPYRHQVTELPPIQPYVIEYQCLDVTCPHCGEATQAPLQPRYKASSDPN